MTDWIKQFSSALLTKALAKTEVTQQTMSRKEPPNEEKLQALKRLRELPRGSQIDSRIAAIRELLGDTEIFQTLKVLRWPHGVICPHCHSSRVVRHDSPPDAPDKRHYYECLNCKGEGNPSDFDDFTGLPIGSLIDLRQCILCWYLIGFCSIHHIAKVLGLSIHTVLKLANLGTELTQLPEAELGLGEEGLEFRKSKQADVEKRAKRITEQEDYTRSESKAPLKPGYKSKK